MISKCRFTAAAAVFFAAALVMSGCGGKKEADPETQEVIKISVTPEPTPTEAPEVTNPDAVTTSGNVTMVNGYTKNGTAGADSTGTASDGTEGASESTADADTADTAADTAAEEAAEDTTEENTSEDTADYTEDDSAEE